MRHLFIITVFVVGALSIIGCAPKKIAPAPDKPVITQPPVTQIQPETKAPETEMAEIKKNDRQKIEPHETITTKELPIEELQMNIRDVLFDFDRYDIRDDAKPALRELAAILSNNRDIKVIIEGHADDRGTNEYNLALGDRRANSVREYLVILGVLSGRIETISFGEEKPICNEQTEECWAKNRRAHFVLIRG